MVWLYDCMIIILYDRKGVGMARQYSTHILFKLFQLSFSPTEKKANPHRADWLQAGPCTARPFRASRHGAEVHRTGAAPRHRGDWGDGYSISSFPNPTGKIEHFTPPIPWVLATIRDCCASVKVLLCCVSGPRLQAYIFFF